MNALTGMAVLAALMAYAWATVAFMQRSQRREQERIDRIDPRIWWTPTPIRREHNGDW